MTHKVKVLAKRNVTHNVRSYYVQKPEGYIFIPGQATSVSFEGETETRPFTLASTNDDLVLEFEIKHYPERQGFTSRLDNILPGDILTIDDPFGTIHYESEGLFIAAGAGITPFLSIFRTLEKKNEIKKQNLLYVNKFHKDIIQENELDYYFNFANNSHSALFLSQESMDGYLSGHITGEVLAEYINPRYRNYYLCGPYQFVLEMKKVLIENAVREGSIIYEK